MTITKILLLIIFLLKGVFSFSQFKVDSVIGKIDPQKWLASVEKKAAKLQDKIIAKSQKTLSKLQRQEEKVYNGVTGKVKDALSKTESLQNKFQHIVHERINTKVIKYSVQAAGT